MTFRLVVTPRARTDLIEIATYVGRDNPAAAESLIDQLEAKSLLLAERPGLGRLHASKSGVRLSSSGRYLIVYRQTDDGIEVLRFVHGRRDLSRIL